MAFHVSKTSILSTLDYIEDGRADIYKWGETRRSQRKGIRGKLYQFKKMFIDKTILRSFIHNLTLIVFLQMALAALGTFMCQKLRLDFDVHMSIFVSPIVFPLAFSINADFQRRERVLEDLAQFKGALVVLFFCHRDWLQSSGLPQDFLKTVNTKLKGLVLNIKEYLLTEKPMRRSFILSVVYEDLSDISQLNDKIRSSSLPHNSPLVTRLIHYHNLMCHAFERLRVIREYRSPRTIRSFTKVFIFLMPIVLSPYYVHMGIKSGNMWSPYYIAVLTSFIFGTLQGVQDVLDDPFDGISEDDINLGPLEDWTAQSLLTNRTITIGRFTVTTKGKEKNDLSESDDDGPSPMMTHSVKVPHKRKPILRKPSFRKVEHGTDDADDAHRKLSLYPETASRLEDLTRRGLTGSTTILPGMKLKRSNSDSLTASSSRASLAQEFIRAQEVDGSGRDSKKVKFSKETVGSCDNRDESEHEDSVFVSPRSHSDPSKYSRSSWMLDENEPLIALDSRSGSSETGTNSLNTAEMDRKDLPEDLYKGLRSSPGTSLVDGRFSVNRNKGNPPLANLFGSNPDGLVDHTDGPAPPTTGQPVSMPSSLQTLFSPPQNANPEKPAPTFSSSLREKPHPRILPISPVARPESPPTSRSKISALPASRIIHSAPTSPEQERRNALGESSAPPTPSPENAVAIPLNSVTRPRKTFLDIPVRKKSSDSLSGSSRFAVNSRSQSPAEKFLEQVADDPLPTSKGKKPGDSSSGNSRFAVNTNAQTPAVDNSTDVAQAPLAFENFAVDTTSPSKPVDMPRSRFNVAKPSNDVVNPQKGREDQPLVTSSVPNYGVMDSSPPTSVQTTPSRFKVNNPTTISQEAERDGEEEAKSDAFQLLSLDGGSTEVFI